MSGHKRATITISEDEYRRLHQAEMKLRFAPQASPQVCERQQKELSDALWQYHTHVVERQDRYDRNLTELNSEVRRLESASAAALVDRQAEYTRAIEAAGAERWERTKALVLEESAQLHELIAEEQQQRVDQVSALDARLQDFSDAEDAKYDAAANWLQTAETLIGFIDHNYNHAFFMPESLPQIGGSLEMAAANLDMGMPEAALSMAQQAYLDLSALRLELERRESEWQTVFQTCYQEANRIAANVAAASTCTAHDLDGKEMPLDIDVNYWSAGELNRLNDQVTRLLNRLDVEPAEMGSGDLAELLENELPQLRKNLEETVYHARLAVLNSQLRINIADLVVQALERQGYALQDAVYTSDDMRRSYAAKVKSLDGSEIVVRVDPANDDVGRNELHLISLDKEMRTEHELMQRSEEISQSLHQFGLEVSDLRQLGGRNQQPSAGRRDSITHTRRQAPRITEE